MSNFENPISDAKNSFSDISQKVEPQNEVEKNKERQVKSIEIKIGENTYSLEAELYDFEYPKRIQEETGIIGYERISISSENIFELYKFDIQPLLEKLNIASFDDFSKRYQDLKTDHKSKIDFQDYIDCDKEIYRITGELLKKVSDGEYPNDCYTHTIGEYAGGLKEVMMEDLKNDKMFLQKIYDIDRIEKNINHGQDVTQIFNHPVLGEGGSRNAYSNFTLYGRDTQQKIKEREYIGKINEHKKELEEGTVFAATPNGGLNLFAGHFWTAGRVGSGTYSDALSFGFPISGDSFLTEYLTKSLELFWRLEKDNVKILKDKYYTRFTDRGIESAFIMYVLNEFSLTEHVPREINLHTEERINTIVDEFFEKRNLSNFFKDNGCNFAKEFLSHIYNIVGLNGEVYLPIVIGDNEIPQLSWGHAKYAHYMNEKGFNFFKFKHADHLPKKIEKGESFEN